VYSVERARTGAEHITPFALLRMATMAAAQGLGFGDTTGSLQTGKRADVILVRHDLNLLPTGDPYDALVLYGRADNVRTVIADGRILKRDGQLTQPSARSVGRTAQQRRNAIVDRARTAGDWPY
jgi:5-methylthioadenosine/S-adenosylhomocysteine deaminase